MIMAPRSLFFRPEQPFTSRRSKSRRRRDTVPLRSIALQFAEGFLKSGTRRGVPKHNGRRSRTALSLLQTTVKGGHELEIALKTRGNGRYCSGAKAGWRAYWQHRAASKSCGWPRKMTRQHWQILLCVLAMDLLLLSLLLVPVNWRYLLCAEASAFVVFGALGWFSRVRRRRLLLLAIPLLLAVQQWAWHEWRADIVSTWWLFAFAPENVVCPGFSSLASWPVRLVPPAMGDVHADFSLFGAFITCREPVVGSCRSRNENAPGHSA
jgi:hypothetical protein